MQSKSYILFFAKSGKISLFEIRFGFPKIKKFLSASKIDNLFNFPKSTISHRFKNQNEFKYKNYLISKNEYELGSKELQIAFDNSYNYEPGIVKNQFTK